ncbi:MAG: EFR1 family ferrodoxin [Eubacterium sp.]|nr:EFR1 family ferrodoxin [Eubacterium sp.]
MKLLKVTSAYFSPAGTTKTVVTRLTDAFSDYPISDLDLTDYDIRQKTWEFHENELLIIGVPAYGGRVPVPVMDFLEKMKGLNTPVVLIATYGNRGIGDTLCELYRGMKNRGFIPVACGSFVCQHTFLSDVARNRPDEEDHAVIAKFGKELRERLRLLVTYDVGKLDIPGNYPYTCPPMNLPFKVETSEYCIYCMLCVSVCPAKAIHPDNPKSIDSTKCIRCGSCLRICPAGAKSFTEKPFKALQDNILRPVKDIRNEPWYSIG